jgi:DNA/RNA-binding domain of Phe-tRNA-synthetase-like protein
MNLIIDESIKHIIPNCRLGYVQISGVTVRGTPPELSKEFFHLQTEVSKVYNLTVLPTLPRILAVRNMFKKLDFDPSRYRPASEALVRRVLQNKGLYYVNSAVDVNNYCSIKFLLPFGLYDFDQIQGDIVYRRAPEGSYVNIAGNTISTDSKPFLTDQTGVFGNPTSDARRTAVTLSTNNLLAVVYADEEVTDAALANLLEFTAEKLVRYNNGTVLNQNIIYA